MNEYLLFIFGIVGLIAGTELCLKGAVKVAEGYHISKTFIGITIISLGTNLPETIVAVNAALDKLKGGDTSGIIYGNPVGASIVAVSLVIGIAGLMSILAMKRSNLLFDGTMLLGSLVLLFLFSFDEKITRLESVVLLLTYIVYYFFLFKKEGMSGKISSTSPRKGIIKWLFALIAGIVIVVYGSELVVDNAVRAIAIDLPVLVCQKGQKISIILSRILHPSVPPLLTK